MADDDVIFEDQDENFKAGNFGSPGDLENLLED